MTYRVIRDVLNPGGAAPVCRENDVPLLWCCAAFVLGSILTFVKPACLIAAALTALTMISCLTEIFDLESGQACAWIR